MNQVENEMLDVCIELLEVDGHNTKKSVKEILKDLKNGRYRSLGIERERMEQEMFVGLMNNLNDSLLEDL